MTFILINAHDSRLEIMFIIYVNNDRYRCKAYIGFPTGTGKFQIGNSPQKNISYKKVKTEEKVVLFSLIYIYPFKNTSLTR